ncbi:MAG: NnrS family protein [Rubrivivax sp.]
MGRGRCLGGAVRARARNRRNYFFIGLLVLIGAAAGAFHLAALGVLGPVARPALQLALDAVLFILSVMGGRVIPMFTNNGVPGAAAAPASGGEGRAGRRAAVLLFDAAGRHRGCRWRLSPQPPRWPTVPVGPCGNRGPRGACRWSGCCT